MKLRIVPKHIAKNLFKSKFPNDFQIPNDIWVCSQILFQFSHLHLIPQQQNFISTIVFFKKGGSSSSEQNPRLKPTKYLSIFGLRLNLCFLFQILGSKIKGPGPLFPFQILGFKIKKVHWTFYSSSIKLLKTSSIISHSAVASSELVASLLCTVLIFQCVWVGLISTCPFSSSSALAGIRGRSSFQIFLTVNCQQDFKKFHYLWSSTKVINSGSCRLWSCSWSWWCAIGISFKMFYLNNFAKSADFANLSITFYVFLD